MRWLALASVLSGCCFGDLELPDPDYHPPPGDDQPIATARAYAEQQALALFGALDGGASATGCGSAALALAFDLTTAVATRGHSGSQTASRVRFDPAACDFALVVLVVWRHHEWVAIGAELRSPTNGIVGRAGLPLDAFTTGHGDHDISIDELFD